MLMETKKIILKTQIALDGQREGDGEHQGCAVVISNKDTYEKPMEIGKQYSGQYFL